MTRRPRFKVIPERAGQRAFYNRERFVVPAIIFEWHPMSGRYAAYVDLRLAWWCWTIHILVAPRGWSDNP